MPNQPVILDESALAEIEARASAATDGPWQRGGNYWDQNTVTADAGKYFIADCHKNPMSAEFIAHARTDIPALCQTVRALRAEIAEWESHRDGIIEAVKTAEARVEELEEANTALREQLTGIATTIEQRAGKYCDRPEDMRERCVAELNALLLEYEKEQQSLRATDGASAAYMNRAAILTTQRAIARIESLDGEKKQ